MTRRKRTLKQDIIKWLLMVLFLSLLTAPAGWADDKNKLSIQPIKPPARFDAEDIDAQKALENRYDHIGPFDSKSEHGIVVGDVGFELADRFAAPSGRLNQGTIVGLVLNENRKVIAIEVLGKE